MKRLALNTTGRTQFTNITSEVASAAREMSVENGVITIFVPHTTAGVTINENADPDVTRDMEMVLDRVIPWTGGYAHGEGNTAAHVKASMMGASCQVIVENGRLALGTWQAIYFCEFDGPRSRTVWVASA